MRRPTDKYNDPGPRSLRNLLLRGGLLLVLAAVIGTLAGWTKRVRAIDAVAPAPNAGFVARRIGSLGDQLDATRGELDLLRIQLDRANAILDNSMKYQIPADLAASIYDIALSEGIDPALGFQLVKIESSFKANARSSMGAIGYTQLQVTTARFYEPDVTERALTQRHATIFRSSLFTEKDVAVRFLKPDLAIVHAVIELSGAVDRQGQQLPRGLGVITSVIEEAAGGWRIMALQNTAVAAQHSPAT